MSASQNPDRIIEALRFGKKKEAIRLIAEEGAWMPFRDPGYFDTESLFPIFSSIQLISPFLRKLGLAESVAGSMKVHKVGSEFFSFASHLEEIVVLNPHDDSEWRLSSDEFRAIASHEKKNGG